MKLSLRLLEKNLLPDPLIRSGVRRLLRARLRQERQPDPEAQQAHFMRFIEALKASPIAVHTADANAQHYEVPTEFFQLILGRHMKYSCGYWPDRAMSLDASEEAMLRLSTERARIENGQRILDLGCGWGAFSLYAAARFPGTHITAVSNSRTQKRYIEAQAQQRSLGNLRVVTADVAAFQFDEQFDRIVSVEMFEHMRNYEGLLRRLADCLRPGGKLFVHIFTHREYAYRYEIEDDSDWMARYFFTGGMMPSEHLLLYFPEHFRILEQWRVGGRHYQRTCESWLRRMDTQRAAIMPLLAQTYGADQALKWWVYWRVFFIACAELFAFRGGAEWFVSHYLFEKR
jgi:cyclopropane-fatty-acyl-phospholipid synthase